MSPLMSSAAMESRSSTETTPAAPRGEFIAILDFGGQYAQLIARRVREAGVFSVLMAPGVSAEELEEQKPRGIILSGGPSSVLDEGVPRCDEGLLELGVPVLGICYPVLGICYGMQLACQMLGCRIEKAGAREYGRARLSIRGQSKLLAGLPANTAVWMSHGDQVHDVDGRFEVLAGTPTCPLGAVRHRTLPFWGVQFHPEVTHTPHGAELLHNFLYEICKCRGAWRMADYMESEVARIRQLVGEERVICGLSGGVDSAVVAALLSRAIGRQLTCIFVDNGLLRKNERELVATTFRDHFDVDLRVTNAGEQFLGDLRGVTDPQEKRRRIGRRWRSTVPRAGDAVPGRDRIGARLCG